ncbi:hypothetical protein EJ08DRAFT_435612 [Tothia fuscella]|uniref:Uncharacterized protein n=1 Tax=Tothia fuscella TaxID=1048955 RepID=A0A9P4P1B5_9PEZI|nr:hypothetical protein EJ08DRAFT_435612 [Tothia fuscella]
MKGEIPHATDDRPKSKKQVKMEKKEEKRRLKEQKIFVDFERVDNDLRRELGENVKPSQQSEPYRPELEETMQKDNTTALVNEFAEICSKMEDKVEAFEKGQSGKGKAKKVEFDTYSSKPTPEALKNEIRSNLRAAKEKLLAGTPGDASRPGYEGYEAQYDYLTKLKAGVEQPWRPETSGIGNSAQTAAQITTWVEETSGLSAETAASPAIEDEYDEYYRRPSESEFDSIPDDKFTPPVRSSSFHNPFQCDSSTDSDVTYSQVRLFTEPMLPRLHSWNDSVTPSSLEEILTSFTMPGYDAFNHPDAMKFDSTVLYMRGDFEFGFFHASATNPFTCMISGSPKDPKEVSEELMQRYWSHDMVQKELREDYANRVPGTTAADVCEAYMDRMPKEYASRATAARVLRKKWFGKLTLDEYRCLYAVMFAERCAENGW